MIVRTRQVATKIKMSVIIMSYESNSMKTKKEIRTWIRNWSHENSKKYLLLRVTSTIRKLKNYSQEKQEKTVEYMSPNIGHYQRNPNRYIKASVILYLYEYIQTLPLMPKGFKWKGMYFVEWTIERFQEDIGW